MPKRQKRWVYSPPKQPKPKVPESVKMDLEKKAEALVETVLKPPHIKPPPEDARFNYIVDIYKVVPQLLLLLCKVSLPWPQYHITVFRHKVCPSGVYWK